MILLPGTRRQLGETNDTKLLMPLRRYTELKDCCPEGVRISDLVLAVLQDLVVGLFVLLGGLLHLDGVDLHTEQLGSEASVKLEAIVVPDLLTLYQS
jgi:hypothetical protein